MLFRWIFRCIFPICLTCGPLFGNVSLKENTLDNEMIVLRPESFGEETDLESEMIPNAQLPWEGNDAGIDFDSTEPLFVSLGSFCGPASTIKTAGRRKASFPFDWYLSVDGEKIIQALDENFQHFFDINYLKPSVNGLLLNTYYHLEFSHEGVWVGHHFNENFMEFVSKYDRRIQRFRKLNYYKGNVFFMRQAWPLSTHNNYSFRDPGNLKITKEYAVRLYNSLKRFFPSLNVHLMILNGAEPGVPEMTMDGKIIFINGNNYSFTNIANYYSENNQ